MKIKLLTCVVGLLIATAAPLSQAQIGVSIGVNTCNYNGYYQPCGVYAPPIGVYLGGGYWGGDHRDHGDRGHRRGRR